MEINMVLPIVALAAGRKIVVVLAVLFITQVFLERPIFSLPWVLRSDGLALGALLALWTRKDSYKLFCPTFLESAYARSALVFVAICSLMLIPAEVGKMTLIPAPLGLVAIVSALLVWAASYNRFYIARNAVGVSVLGWIGARSFSIYLIHVPLIMIFRQLSYSLLGKPVDGFFNPWFFSSVMAGIILFAELNYRFIENPLRRKGAEILKTWGTGDAGGAAVHFEAANSVSPAR